MELDTKDFNFWRSFGDLKLRQVVLAWDFVAAVLIGVGGSWLYVIVVPDVAKHATVAGDFLTVAGALFGVVLGGFAVAAAFLGDKYSRLLRASGASPLKMLRHFLIAGGILVASIVTTVVYRAGTEAVFGWRPGVEQIIFGLAAFLFLWGLFTSMQLMKLVLAVAITSTALHAITDQTQQPMGQQQNG